MNEWREAVRYRNGAEMLRTIADETPRMDHRESLRRVARYCEAMAATIEHELRSLAAAA